MTGNFSSEENFVEVKGLHQSRDVGARSACRFLMWQFSTADIVYIYIYLACVNPHRIQYRTTRAASTSRKYVSSAITMSIEKRVYERRF